MLFKTERRLPRIKPHNGILDYQITALVSGNTRQVNQREQLQLLDKDFSFLSQSYSNAQKMSHITALNIHQRDAGRRSFACSKITFFVLKASKSKTRDVLRV